jgi:hypothetical protein
MASGYASARNQEMLGSRSALAQALGQRDSINSNSYLQLLGAQLGLSESQLKAMLGNQNYASTLSGQPNQFQKLFGMASGVASGIAGAA